MNVKEIESAISELPPAQVAELADWFDAYRAQLWDKQIEQDLDSGRLQTLLDEAKSDLEFGRCEPL
ncbi:MAG TPA: hypothetical protein VJS13_07075 [Pyrinomonadaceae bacterium]|nr:hypothetical protein [Pyrinomonadaceae bacterium]